MAIVRCPGVSDAIDLSLLPSKSIVTISPARRTAFEILRRVELEGAYASALLAAPDERLRDDDRALSHELVLGVLRRQLWLDRALDHFSQRSLDRLDVAARLALRLGLYQLRFLSRIPSSAAVNESVNLVRAARLSSAASFVNAVLRRATREMDYDPAMGVSEPAEKLAIEASHPVWLIERWSDAFGFEEAAAIARANNDPAPLAFRFTAKAVATDRVQLIIDELSAAGAELAPSKIAPSSWRVGRLGAAGIIRQLSRDGLIYLQDEASQLVSHILAARSIDRVLDVCAAPGSKSTHIAALSSPSMIVAGDLHEHRLRTLNELAQQQGGAEIHSLAHDATQRLPFADSTFDRVLIDAPCSGTGTLRRNPEIRWRIRPADLADLAGKQTQILTSAVAAVRPGGRLVYSTCSLEPEENEGVVEDFVRGHPEFHPVRPEASTDLQTSTGAVRTWPHRQDVDGFFVAVFERQS